MLIAFRSADGFAKQRPTRNLGHPPLENSVRMGSQSLVCCVWRNGDPVKREPEQWLLNRMAARQGQTGEPFSEQGEGSITLPIYCRLWDFSSDSCTKKTLRHPLFGEIPALLEDCRPRRAPAAPAPYAGFNHDTATRTHLGDVRAAESRRMSFRNTVKPIPTHQ